MWRKTAFLSSNCRTRVLKQASAMLDNYGDGLGPKRMQNVICTILESGYSDIKNMDLNKSCYEETNKCRPEINVN